ncbi:MAG: hypothetical protein KAX49_20580 [Halanaerobiales bacterium]|nr:hypothetical protein [Halanaerobiales bacterium]
MKGSETVLSVENFFEEAKEMLEKRNLVGFVENITSAKLLARDDKKFFAKILFWRAKGLYLFRNFEMAFDAINEALEYNDGSEMIKLQKYKGLIFGYHGRLGDAISLFKELVEQTDDITLMVELYINIAWANLILYRQCEEDLVLKEAKIYLDKANQVFDKLTNIKKKQILINYSDYYFVQKDHDKAIEKLKSAINYCQEEDLPKIYNNLAELYLIDNQLVLVNDYLYKAEIIANKYSNFFEIGQALFITSNIEINNEEWSKAVDTLYVAFENFKLAQAFPYAFNCFTKILEISQSFNISCINSLRESIKCQFKNTPFYEKI